MSTETGLKIVFMGTPAVAVPVLSALLEAGHRIVGVYTQPDRPAGRGRPLLPSAVKEHAVARGLPVYQPASLSKDEYAQQELAALSPDLLVVAAYGLFLPTVSFETPRLGALNVHPSLLPRYRGPSPVASAILNGDSETGVTIMQLDEGMDTGPIVVQHETPIDDDETAENLTIRLFEMGAQLLVETLPGWARGDIGARPQDETQAIVTRRLSRQDGEIDWGRPADELTRQVRAYHPWPGSFSHWHGKLLKVLEASPAQIEPMPSAGVVVLLPNGDMGVGTGRGVLLLQRVQMEGRRAVTGREFVAGHRDFVGSTLRV